jgi:PadR family transcriptional regulator PadR
MPPDTLGELEHLILLAIKGIRDKNAYGVTIFDALNEHAERPTTLGAIYATLARLERKGYVTSWFGEPTRERGGRAKRFFRLHRTGHDALRRAERSMQRLRSLAPAGIELPEPPYRET